MRFLVITVLACLLVTPLHAQSPPNESTAHRANPRFAFMAGQAQEHRNPNFNFTRFRRLYAETRQYDPIGDDTLDQLIQLSFEAENAPSEDIAARTYAEFRLLTKDHLANLSVVLYAASLARSNPQYGDVTFYNWVRDGLIRDVMISGNGKTFDDAYDVITLAEETALFYRLGLRSVTADYQTSGFYRYTRHQAENPQSGLRQRIYVNTTYPVKFLEKNRNTQNDLGIMRQ